MCAKMVGCTSFAYYQILFYLILTLEFSHNNFDKYKYNLYYQDENIVNIYLKNIIFFNFLIYL